MLSTCPGCQRQFNLPDDLAGKRLGCPACDTIFPIASEAIRAGDIVEERWRDAPHSVAIAAGQPRAGQRNVASDEGLASPVRKRQVGLDFFLLAALLLFACPAIEIVFVVKKAGRVRVDEDSFLGRDISGAAVRGLSFNVVPGVFMIVARSFFIARRFKGMVIAGATVAITCSGLNVVFTLVLLDRTSPIALPEHRFVLPAICYPCAALVAIVASIRFLLLLRDPIVAAAFARNTAEDSGSSNPASRR
ncbi:MAG: hypothetical protein U0793_24890 [Gemmataceae bacterium]